MKTCMKTSRSLALAALTLALSAFTLAAAPSTARADDRGADAGNGAGTVRADSGATTTDETPAAHDDDGCSASGAAPENGVTVALGVGFAFAVLGRRRPKQRRARTSA